MPLYDYACQSCGKTTEILQKYGDPPLAICPHCGGDLKKLLSAPSFQFKGSGWYATDYARKSGGGSAKGSSSGGGSGGEGGGSESGSGGGSEAKSEKSGGAGGDAPSAKPSKPSE